MSDLGLWFYTLKTNRLSHLSKPRDPRCSKAFLFLPESKKRSLKNVMYVDFCHANLTKCHLFEILQLAPLCPRITLRAYSDKALRVNFGIEKASGKQHGAPKTTREA